MSEETSVTEKPAKKKRFRVSGEVELMAAKAITRRILEVRPGRRQAVVNMVGEYLRAEGHSVQFALVPETIDSDGVAPNGGGVQDDLG